MIQRVYIGPTVVEVHASQLLPPSLRGYLRAPAPGVAHEVELRIEQLEAPTWTLDILQQGDTHTFGRPRHALEISPNANALRLLLCPGLDFDDLYWIQRDIFGALACLSGGLMLHASAVRGPDGRAYVFCGASGAGKSTLARLLQERGLQAVSDEINWLTEREGGLALVNQPYWMRSAEEDFLPLGGLYLLQQGAECAFREAPPQAEVFSRLLSVHLSIDNAHEFLRRRAEALARLVQTRAIPVLEFNLDINALWTLLWNSPPSSNV